MLLSKPSYTEHDLDRVIVSKEQIHSCVTRLGKQLSEYYAGNEITVISILSGALVFTADLIRACEIPTRLDSLRAESYGSSVTPQSQPRITSPLKTDVEGRNVLVVDDILDSGATLRSICKHLEQASPASIKTCVLLDKPSRHPSSLQADFKGFTIPDEFVVGYGLDFAERYRHLPCIGVLKKEFQNLEHHA